MKPPDPLPSARVEWEKLSAYFHEFGVMPTPENAPELFADELAMQGFALAEREPFVDAERMFCDSLDARPTILHALRRIRERAARQWLWTNRERVRLGAGRLVLPADLTDDERELLRLCREEVVKLLRDGEVADWFLSDQQPETPSLRGPSNVAPSGAV